VSEGFPVINHLNMDTPRCCPTLLATTRVNCQTSPKIRQKCKVQPNFVFYVSPLLIFQATARFLNEMFAGGIYNCNSTFYGPNVNCFLTIREQQ
jgi:hypothetical protein